jgi:hypothetical protein
LSFLSPHIHPSRQTDHTHTFTHSHVRHAHTEATSPTLNLVDKLIVEASTSASSNFNSPHALYLDAAAVVVSAGYEVAGTMSGMTCSNGLGQMIGSYSFSGAAWNWVRCLAGQSSTKPVVAAQLAIFSSTHILVAAPFSTSPFNLCGKTM